MNTGIICGLAAGATWGLVFLLPRVLGHIDPLLLMLGRYLAYGAISMVLAVPAWRALRAYTRQDWRTLWWLSLTGNLAYYWFVALGVQWTGIAVTSLIVGILPITITLCSAKVRSQQTLPLKRLIGPLVLIALGIILIQVQLFSAEISGVQQFSAQVPKTPRAHNSELFKLIAGVFFAVAALVSWTYYSIANSLYLQKNPHHSSQNWNTATGLVTGALALIFATVYSLCCSVIVGDWPSLIISSMVIAFFASTVGAALWNVASKRLSVSLTGQLIVSETLFALLYGYIYETRWPSFLEAAAILLLLTGVIWAVRLHIPQTK